MNDLSQTRPRFSTLWSTAVLLLGLVAISLPSRASEPDALELDARFRDYVELLRSDLKSGKVIIYSRVMQLSDEEAKAFWPIYQQYETELFALGDRRLALIKRFAVAYGSQTLDDATAKSLTRDWFSHQENRIKLWKKYQKLIEKEINATRAAQFLQIENRINALLDLMIASEIPLIDPAAGAMAESAKRSPK